MQLCIFYLDFGQQAACIFCLSQRTAILRPLISWNFPFMMGQHETNPGILQEGLGSIDA